MVEGSADKPRRKTNQQEKLQLAQAELLLFVKQWGRKAQKGAEPNDRSHDRNLERRIKKMKPELLDELIRGDDPASESD